MSGLADLWVSFRVDTSDFEDAMATLQQRADALAVAYRQMDGSWVRRRRLAGRPPLRRGKWRGRR